VAITAFSDKPHLGGISLIKDTGEVSSGNALLTQIDIPFTQYNSDRDENNVYPAQGNASAGPVTVGKGKKTNTITFVTPCHPTYFTFKNINDWIGGSASYLNTTNSIYDTSGWSANIYEPVLGNQRYTTGKCLAISISYSAAAGTLNMMQTWTFISGAEQGSPDTFAAPTRVTGLDYAVADMTSASWDLMRSWNINIVRGQQYQMYGDGTRYATAITSHAIGGILTMEQGPTASQGNQVAAATDTLSGSGILIIGPSTTRVKITAYVNRDSRRRVVQSGNQGSTEFFNYSLGDFGGANSGYPVAIIAAP